MAKRRPAVSYSSAVMLGLSPLPKCPHPSGAPSIPQRLEREVDPDRKLPPDERTHCALRAYMLRLSSAR